MIKNNILTICIICVSFYAFCITNSNKSIITTLVLKHTYTTAEGNNRVVYFNYLIVDTELYNFDLKQELSRVYCLNHIINDKNVAELLNQVEGQYVTLYDIKKLDSLNILKRYYNLNSMVNYKWKNINNIDTIKYGKLEYYAFEFYAEYFTFSCEQIGKTDSSPFLYEYINNHKVIYPIFIPMIFMETKYIPQIIRNIQDNPDIFYNFLDSGASLIYYIDR